MVRDMWFPWANSLARCENQVEVLASELYHHLRCMLLTCSFWILFAKCFAWYLCKTTTATPHLQAAVMYWWLWGAGRTARIGREISTDWFSALTWPYQWRWWQWTFRWSGKTGVSCCLGHHFLLVHGWNASLTKQMVKQSLEDFMSTALLLGSKCMSNFGHGTRKPLEIHTRFSLIMNINCDTVCQ